VAKLAGLPYIAIEHPVVVARAADPDVVAVIEDMLELVALQIS
jgi:hypothetical protein